MNKSIFIVSVCVLLAGNSFAASKCDVLYPQLPSADELEVELPFNKKPVSNGEDDAGLCFSYVLKQNSPQKLVCEVSNLNEGWMLYKDNNVTRETSTYSGNKTVIFTSRGLTGPVSDQIDQYHVDEN